MRLTGLSELGIHVSFDESDIMKASVMIIGPKNTPYENGILYFSVEFPQEYPFSPPQIQYVSTSRLRIHPNLYVGLSHQDFRGKVCLSIINTWSGPKWSSAMDLGAVLITIQSLLCDKAITHEPGYEKSPPRMIEIYNDIIQYDTFRHLILCNQVPFDPSFAGFNELIQTHLVDSRADILSRLDEYCKKYPEKTIISLKLYGLSIEVDFPSLKHKFDLKEPQYYKD